MPLWCRACPVDVQRRSAHLIELHGQYGSDTSLGLRDVIQALPADRHAWRELAAGEWAYVHSSFQRHRSARIGGA